MKLFNKIAVVTLGSAMAMGLAIVGLSSEKKIADAAPSGNNTYTAITSANITTALKENDKVVYWCDSLEKAVTGFSNSDATLSETEADWLQFTVVDLSGNSFKLYNSADGKYVKANAGNKFTIDAASSGAAVGTIQADGAWYYTDSSSAVRSLGRNGDYYRCYKTSSGYENFLIFKVTEGGGDPTALSSVSISQKYAVKAKTDSLTLTADVKTATDVTFSWASDNPTVASVSSAGVVTPTGTKGIANITVTATKGSTTLTDTCKVAFLDTDGSTAEKALSEADATTLAAGSAFEKMDDKLYIKGTVASISYKDGQATIDLTGGFEFYKIYDIGGAKFTDETKIAVGDVVTVYSNQIKEYSGKAEACYGSLISIASDRVLSYIDVSGEITIEVSVGEDFNLSELTVTAYYSNGDEVDVTDYATLYSDPVKATTVGTQTILVKAAYNDYEMEWQDAVEFEVTVVAAVTTVDDVLDASMFAATSSQYKDFANVSGTSGAVYAGNSAKDGTGDGSIQLRAKEKAGVLTTKAGGKRVRSVTIQVKDKASSGSTISIFGSNAPMGANALYDGSATELGTVTGNTAGTYKFTLVGDYKYVGVRGTSAAVYIHKITIAWEVYTAAEVAAEIKTLAGGWNNNVGTEQCYEKYATAKEMVLTLSSAELSTFQTSSDSDIAGARAAYEKWCEFNGDTTPYEGSIVTKAKASVVTDSMLSIVVIASVITVCALGALLILRKKQAVR